MAKINAYGNHQVGPTYFTEREFGSAGTLVHQVITEAWRIRSDRMVQRRIVSVTDVASGKVRKGTSTFRNIGTLTGTKEQAEALRTYIQGRIDNGSLVRIVKVRP